MFEKLAKQLKRQQQGEKTQNAMTSPIGGSLKKLSEHAIDLYVKKTDLKKFTKLALSDPEDKSHNELIEKLLRKNEIIDPLDEKNLEGLIGNDNFLRDLGL